MTANPNAVPEIDVHEAKRRHQAGARLIDVREANEHAANRIPGAELLPLSELAERYGELPDDGELVIHCRSGGRSGRAVEFLRAHGYDAVNVAGGILAWAEEGLDYEGEEPS